MSATLKLLDALPFEEREEIYAELVERRRKRLAAKAPEVRSLPWATFSARFPLEDMTSDELAWAVGQLEHEGGPLLRLETFSVNEAGEKEEGGRYLFQDVPTLADPEDEAGLEALELALKHRREVDLARAHPAHLLRHTTQVDTKTGDSFGFEMGPDPEPGSVSLALPFEKVRAS